jgi:hypothetical protein
VHREKHLLKRRIQQGLFGHQLKNDVKKELI